MSFLADGRRKGIAVLLLAGLGLLAWETIDPGQVRWVVMVVLGGFALRILLAAGSRDGADTR
ncbi:MAG TPA: hypothetical protein VM554_11640 [Acidisarcina sp.]|nr:hypothetical protein [Acidisarcina sp.]